jgi:hypothetical protein
MYGLCLQNKPSKKQATSSGRILLDGYWLGLLLGSEDGGNIPPNVGELLLDYTASNPTEYKHSS